MNFKVFFGFFFIVRFVGCTPICCGKNLIQMQNGLPIYPVSKFKFYLYTDRCGGSIIILMKSATKADVGWNVFVYNMRKLLRRVFKPCALSQYVGFVEAIVVFFFYIYI